MTLIVIMKYKILSSLALAVLGITAIAPFASAVPRFVKSGVNNDVTGTGFTAGQKVELGYAGVTSVKDVTASKCGVVTISGLSATSDVTVDGVGYSLPTVFTLSAVPSPTDRGGGNCDWEYSGKLLQPDGSYRLYVGGLTPLLRQSVTINGPAIRKATANACGFIKLKNSGEWKDKAFTYSGTAVTPTSISVDPQCKNGVALYPTNFPGVSFTP